MSDQLVKQIQWPPPYEVRRSLKAKNISLRVLPGKGLELVLPKRASLAAGLAFLEEKRYWVERHAAAIYLTNVNEPLEPPTELFLPVLDKRWLLFYESFPISRIKLIEAPDQLTLLGAVDEFKHCQSILKKFLKQQAEALLTPMFEQLSQATGLSYESLNWRFQRTLWGSCTAKTNISLNVKLLFLEEALVKQVMLHELCHTKHLNHSTRFWQLVERFQPDYQQLEKQLLAMTKLLPSWVGCL